MIFQKVLTRDRRGVYRVVGQLDTHNWTVGVHYVLGELFFCVGPLILIWRVE